MDLLAVFINWQFLLLTLGISAFTYVLRTVVEYVILNNPRMPGSSNSRFWREFVLVLFPVLLGFAFGHFATSFPYPEGILEPYSRLLFSAVAGLLSPTLYRVIKALLWRNAGVNDPSLPPPPPAPPNPFFPPQPTFLNPVDPPSNPSTINPNEPRG